MMGNDCDSKRKWTFENGKSNIGRDHQVENQAIGKDEGNAGHRCLVFQVTLDMSGEIREAAGNSQTIIESS
jgi:hypothetical protein